MNVEQFIDQIAGKGLLDEALLQRLRRDSTAGDNQWTPQDVVKFLVEQGHLTRFQGKNLLRDIQSSEPATHESLDFASSESIDGLSIGAVSDEDEDDEEIIDLEAAMPASVVADDSQQSGDDVVDLSQASTVQTPVAQQVPLQPAILPVGTALSGDEAGLQGEVGANGTFGYGEAEIPTTLLDRQFNNQIWDKRFLYATISVALLLFVATGVFYFIINNRSADAKFEMAIEAYGSSQYEGAVTQLAEFAEQFSTDPRVDEAMALVYLSHIHLAIATGEREAIKQIEKAITTGKDIPGFSSRARDELKVVLPRFAKVFLGQAETSRILEQKKENYELAVEALNLINLPGALGTTRSEPAVRADLEGVGERMASVKRHIDRDTHLEIAVDEMATAVSESRIAAAFESRTRLHDLYPELKSDQRLSSVLRQMLDAERTLAGKVLPKWQASTDTTGLLQGVAVTATTSGQPISDAQGQIAVLAGGNIVGLNIADGTVLWQHFVGQQTTLRPVKIGMHSVFANQQENEILSVLRADGSLKWRLALDGEITSVSASGSNVVVTLNGESGGILLLIDSANGNIQLQVNTSLELMTAPAFSRDASVAYLAADHSYIYAIDLNTGKCLDVYFLDHGIGTVPYPPVVVNDYVIVARNLNNQAGLIVLRQQEQKQFSGSGDVVRVPGLLSSELGNFQDRIILTTQSGEVRLFAVEHQEDLTTPPVVPLAASSMETRQPTRHFIEMKSESVSVGAAGLWGFAISSDGQLSQSSHMYQEDLLVTATQTIDSVVIAQRKRVGASAITVSGMILGGQVSWETDLTALSDSTIVANGQTAVTVDSQAQVFDVQKGGSAEISQLLTAGRGYSHAISLGKQLVLQSLTDSSDLLVFDVVGESESAKRIPLQNLTDVPTGGGVAFSGHLLLPLADGQIALFDVTTGKQSLVSYQPVKEPGEVIHWSVAALPSENADSFVVVRGRMSLKKIGINPTPVPHLELQSEAIFEAPIYNQVAATEETVYLIRRGRNSDEIVGLSYDSLEELSVQEVAGRVVWGPNRIGEVVLVYTSASRVYCFDGQQRLLWRSDNVDFSPVGKGIEQDEDFLLTGVEGILWRINAKTGETVSKSQLGKRVIGNPFVVAGEVWIPTEAGIVLGSVQQ